MSLRFCPNLSVLFGEAPFLDRFELAAKAGFAAVEFLFPYEYGIDQVSNRLEQLELRAVLFDIQPGEPGEVGTLCCPRRRDYFRESFSTALDAADRLDCQRINVLFGNRDPDLEPAAQTECAVENLLWAAPQAEQAGATLLLEPLSAGTAPNYFLRKSAEVLKIIPMVGHRCVRLQYDFYHAQIEEGNLIHTVSECFDSIGHIQISDVPGRHEPGTGEINYANIFAHLENLGYKGFIGLEYQPMHGTVESLSWLPLENRGLA